jgi:hypothetical protein
MTFVVHTALLACVCGTVLIGLAVDVAVLIAFARGRWKM